MNSGVVKNLTASSCVKWVLILCRSQKNKRHNLEWVRSELRSIERQTLALNQKLAAQKKLQAELDILNGVVLTVTATTEDATNRDGIRYDCHRDQRGSKERRESGLG